MKTVGKSERCTFGSVEPARVWALDTFFRYLERVEDERGDVALLDNPAVGGVVELLVDGVDAHAAEG